MFPLDREAEDHVYCMFEFPGPGYDPNFEVGYKDPYCNIPDPKKGSRLRQGPQQEDRRQYSSINGNGFGGYGEMVIGTKGTLILETEKEVMLYKTLGHFVR